MIIKLKLNDVDTLRSMFKNIETYEVATGTDILDNAIAILETGRELTLSRAVAQAFLDDEPIGTHETIDSIINSWTKVGGIL